MCWVSRRVIHLTPLICLKRMRRKETEFIYLIETNIWSEKGSYREWNFVSWAGKSRKKVRIAKSTHLKGFVSWGMCISDMQWNEKQDMWFLFFLTRAELTTESLGENYNIYFSQLRLSILFPISSFIISKKSVLQRNKSSRLFKLRKK